MTVFHAVLERSLELLPFGVVVVDGDGVVVFWNGWMEDRTAVPVDGALGRPLLEVLDAGEVSARFQRALDDALRDGVSAVLTRAFQAYHLPLRVPHEPARRIAQRISLQPFDEEGQRYCLIDVVDQGPSAKKEEWLRERNAELSRRLHLVRELASELDAPARVLLQRVTDPARKAEPALGAAVLQLRRRRNAG